MENNRNLAEELKRIALERVAEAQADGCFENIELSVDGQTATLEVEKGDFEEEIEFVLSVDSTVSKRMVRSNVKTLRKQYRRSCHPEAGDLYFAYRDAFKSGKELSVSVKAEAGELVDESHVVSLEVEGTPEWVGFDTHDDLSRIMEEQRSLEGEN